VAVLVVSGTAATRSVPLSVIGGVAVLAVILYVFLRWSLSNAAIALEPVGPLEGLARSRAVTRGNVWRILAVYALLVLLIAPLQVGLTFLALEATSAPLQIAIGVASGLAITPLLSIVATTIFGDLTGRPEAAPSAAPSRRPGVFAAGVIIAGVLSLAASVPTIGPALERLTLQSVPVEVRGQILAGTALNPADACRPIGPKATFSSGETIYIGGYFSRIVPAGETIDIEIFVNGRSAGSSPQRDPTQALACYYEPEALDGVAPGTYRLVISVNGETIAEGQFAVQ
jgi:hypothetical protein